MHRTTLIAAAVASVLVLGYAGWLSAAGQTDSGGGGSPSETGEQGTGGKPGEAAKP